MNDKVLTEIQNVIDSRKGQNPETSYVAQLLHKGEDKILKKVIEEAGEVLMASKDGGGEHLVYEVADLWFHTQVLLAHHGLRVEEVVNELARRQGLSGLAEKAARQDIEEQLDLASQTLPRLLALVEQLAAGNGHDMSRHP